MTHSPTVSVIIPVYNGEKYLAEALESVLAQTHPIHEIIVVDDGSTDGSAAIAACYSPLVRVITTAHVGPPIARNHGADAATGEWLAFLDADDLWLPEKLQQQLAAAFKAGVSIAFGGVTHFLSPELDAATRQRIYCPLGLEHGPMPSNFLVQQEIFAALDGFDPRWRMGELLDWYTRAGDAGYRAVTIPDLVLRRRIHAANRSLEKVSEQVDLARIVKANLDRRRAAGQLPARESAGESTR
jgi:glycosyltransferase involved in cell wall biosynthesis